MRAVCIPVKDMNINKVDGYTIYFLVIYFFRFSECLWEDAMPEQRDLPVRFYRQRPSLCLSQRIQWPPL